MKKAILRVLLVICGLNVFTACYGMPPGDWDVPEPLPEEQEKAMVADPSDGDSNLEEAAEAGLE